MAEVPEMVEHVARHLCMLDGDDPDCMVVPYREPVRTRTGLVVVPGAIYPLWMTRCNEARKAIEAMRKPTYAMLREFGRLPLNIEVDDEERTARYAAMIDAALGKQPA